MSNKSNRKELLRAIRGTEVMPARNGEYWRDDERNQLKKLYNEGVGISEIALMLQRSENSIIQQLTYLEVLRAPKPRKSYRKKPKCLCFKCELHAICPYAMEQREEG